MAAADAATYVSSFGTGVPAWALSSAFLHFNSKVAMASIIKPDAKVLPFVFINMIKNFYNGFC